LVIASLLSPAAGLAAEDRWTAYKSSQFELITNGSDREAREKLMFLEQFREAIRVITGKDEIKMVWPVRVLVYKNAKQAPAKSAHFALGRDARMEWLAETDNFSPESRKELARVFLSENLMPLPRDIEEGIVALVSTLEVNGTRLSLGAPVPMPERTPGWALMQMVSVNPDYSGRSRVMISNLEQSDDFEAACRNAFQKSGAEIRQQAEAYLKAGNFQAGSISGRALSPQRDFKQVPLDANGAGLAQADLLLAVGSADAGPAYAKLTGPKAEEGQALIALKNGKDAEAGKLLEDSVNPDSDSARAWLEIGRLEPRPSQANDDFEKAAARNRNWGEPYFQEAQNEDDTQKRAALLKKAASLAPRNMEYWQELAHAQTYAKNFVEAQKAWGVAERLAPTDAERAKIHQARLDSSADRADFDVSERKRVRQEREDDLARVKAESEAAIHAAEDAANKKLNPKSAPQPQNAVWMDELKGNATVDGVFERLDCIGEQARMQIKTDDGGTVQLLIRNPSSITLSGGGEKSIACGAQAAARRVHVEYQGKADAKLHTAGDVTTIEFR
jgi:hypothetical protein